MNNLIVDALNAGKRIDAYIAENVENMSRSACVNLIEEGNITVNGKKIKKNYKVSEGDSIEITMPELKPYEALPQKMDLDIRYEDKDVLVINKQKGLVVHPAPGNEDGTLVNALLDYCKEDLSGIGGVQRPGIVHRIDKETSGLLIVAKNDMAHRHLSDQLKTRTLSRRYYALVLGNIKEDSGTIDAPIGRSLKDRKKMAIIANGRDAVTHFRVLARYVGYTLVECKLQTGRTHQIRVHMAHIHHPIAGDNVYGNKTDKSGIDGQCLHAKELEFIHPATGENVHVECPLPEYFETFLKKLKPLE